MAAEDPTELHQKLQSLSTKWKPRPRSASSPAAPQHSYPSGRLAADAVWPDDIQPRSVLPTNRSPVMARKSRSASTPPAPPNQISSVPEDEPDDNPSASSSTSMNLAPIQESADKEVTEMQYSNDSSPNYSPVPGHQAASYPANTRI